MPYCHHIYRVRHLPGYLYSVGDLRRTEWAVAVQFWVPRRYHHWRFSAKGPGARFSSFLLPEPIQGPTKPSMQKSGPPQITKLLPPKIGIHGDGGLCIHSLHSASRVSCRLHFRLHDVARHQVLDLPQAGAAPSRV